MATWIQWTLTGLALALAVPIFRSLQLLYRHYTDSIPGPFPWPVVSSLHAVLPYLKRTHERMLSYFPGFDSDIIRFAVLTRSAVAVRAPEDVKTMLALGTFGRFDRNPEEVSAFGPLLGDGLVLVSNAQWKEQRSLVTPVFRNENLKELHHLSLPHLDELVGVLDREVRLGAEGCVLDAEDLFRRLTFDVIAAATLGETFHCLEGPLDQTPPVLHAFETVAEHLFQRFIWWFPYWKLCKTRAVREYERSMKLLNDTVKAKLSERLQERELRRQGRPQMSAAEAAAAAAADEDGEGGRGASTQTLPEGERSSPAIASLAPETMPDLLSCILDARQDALDAGMEPEAFARLFSEERMCKQVMTFLFAGHDTTASMLASTLYFLADRPTLLQQVRREAEEADAELQEQLWEALELEPDHKRRAQMEKKLRYESLRKLGLLERCILESLRLRPPIPGRTRIVVNQQRCPAGFSSSSFEGSHEGRASAQESPHAHQEKPVYLAGRPFHSKMFWPWVTGVVWGAYYTHRMEKHWPDPEHFDPGRFEKDRRKGRHPFAYVPFGAGPRRCVGRELAMLEGKSVLARLVREFHFEVDERTTAETELHTTLRSASGIWLQIRKRQRQRP